MPRQYPYEPAGHGADHVVLLAHPDMSIQGDRTLAPPLRHNNGSDRHPYAHLNRGHSDSTEHHCGQSLRILGEPLSMRAELGGIHYALEFFPVDEELTIFTDPLSAIRLLCQCRSRWQKQKRVF